jgi:hypothetical protein
MKLYITKQLDFCTQIYTQKHTKHYYLIKLKTQLDFGTQIYTQKYSSFKLNFYSIPIIKFHIKNLHTIIISN